MLYAALKLISLIMNSLYLANLHKSLFVLIHNILSFSAAAAITFTLPTILMELTSKTNEKYVVPISDNEIQSQLGTVINSQIKKSEGSRLKAIAVNMMNFAHKHFVLVLCLFILMNVIIFFLVYRMYYKAKKRLPTSRTKGQVL